MDEKIIVDEFLNNFYTISELANYLEIDENIVRQALNNVTGSKKERIDIHLYCIENYDEEDERINASSDFEKRIVGVANYIISTKSSIRIASKKLEISKTTIGEYMNFRLPYISIFLYKKVFDIFHSHKSLNPDLKERQEEIREEVELLEKGYTLEEIGSVFIKSYSSVQRDLANRSKNIDDDVHSKVKTKLHENKSHKGKKIKHFDNK